MCDDRKEVDAGKAQAEVSQVTDEVVSKDNGKVGEEIAKIEKISSPKMEKTAVEENGNYKEENEVVNKEEHGKVGEEIAKIEKISSPEMEKTAVEENGNKEENEVVNKEEHGKVGEEIAKIENIVVEENGNKKENEVVGEEEHGKVGEEIAKIEKTSVEENGNKEENGECSSSPSLSRDVKDGESMMMSEENGFLSDLKENEKKSFMELRSKLEEAILTNNLFKKDNVESEKEEESNKSVEENDKQEKATQDDQADNKGKSKVDDEISVDHDHNITLWGVPLLPSKGDKSTDVLLLKFLKAREFKAGDAFDMLKGTLEWRKENKIDSIMEEDFGNEYDSVGYMKGSDREGRPICYNVYGVFANEEMYNKTFGTESSRERFLRWRLQLLEKEIQELDIKPGGISTLVQINDLKDTPGPSRRDLRLATKRAVEILQDNYPEFVAINIFINVPFWYYAFNALLTPFLTQTTKSKFVFSRPARVTETLIKYIRAEEIPVVYGGLRSEDDPEFTTKDVATEIIVKAGATGTIEIPAPEVGSTLTWDLTIVGWDVSYKEEFVPKDEASYTLIVKKERKISWQQESIRNSFTNKEAGKLVITIQNSIFKKKRVFYRYKIKNNSADSSASST